MELEWHRAAGAARARLEARTSRTSARSRTSAAAVRRALPRRPARGRRARARRARHRRARRSRSTARAWRAADPQALHAARGRARRARVQLELRVPAPQLWSPDAPRLYSAKFTLRDRDRVVQVEKRRVGLRSVEVKGGLLYLNNRRIQLRGASIHEDMPGSGAALTSADMDRIVADLKTLGANVTRAHYLLNARLLSASTAPASWSGARRRSGNVTPAPTCCGSGRSVRAPSRPSAAPSPPRARTLRADPLGGQRTELHARTTIPGPSASSSRHRRTCATSIPTLPISVDIKGRPGFAEQFTYGEFDMLGLNQYFGWYRWVEDFTVLEPYIYELRDHYPDKAIVMTEWGAEARPRLARRRSTSRGATPSRTCTSSARST